MGTLLVLAAAVGVGVLVFRLTAGGEEPARTTDGASGASSSDDVGPWVGDEPGAGRAGSVAAPERQPPASPEVPVGYIPVSPGGPSWHARLGGAMGLVIAVAVGAIALAVSLWALVSLVGRLLVSSDAGV